MTQHPGEHPPPPASHHARWSARSGRTSADARLLVEASLSESALGDGIERAILGDPVDAGPYWVFFYQGRAYIERDEFDAMLVGNAPIVVPKDGGGLFTLSLSDDIDAQIRALAERA